MKLNTMRDLFIHELRDLHHASKQVTDALPKMTQTCTSQDLRSAFQADVETTREQSGRLEQIFQDLDVKPRGVTCDAMRGIISEGQSMWKAQGDPMVRDAALIAAAQRIKHYLIAAYGCARTYARTLGEERAGQMLQKSLDEAHQSDRKLTRMAEETINVEAARV